MSTGDPGEHLPHGPGDLSPDRRMGVLRVSVFEAPLRNIQHTSVFRLLRERLFGLGSIGFATAGSDVFDAFWVTVRQPFGVHRTVVEAIRRYGRH